MVGAIDDSRWNHPTDHCRGRRINVTRRHWIGGLCGQIVSKSALIGSADWLRPSVRALPAIARGG